MDWWWVSEDDIIYDLVHEKQIKKMGYTWPTTFFYQACYQNQSIILPEVNEIKFQMFP